MSEQLESSGVEDAYFDRNQAVQALARLAQAQGCTIGIRLDADPHWTILFIDLPTGQVSWHIKTEEMIDQWPIYKGWWDHHTLEDKRARMHNFIKMHLKRTR